MRRQKIAALSLLAAVSLLGPMTERIATGRVDDFSAYAIVDTVISLVLIFWWFHADKAERGYRAGKLMNAGMLVMVVIALPVYLIRSRGWKRGGIAVALAGGFLLLMLGLETAGEYLGALVSP
jgi:hypothetical protein